MRMRDFFTTGSFGDLGLVWKTQMLLGALLVLLAVAIVAVPEILVALVATLLLMAGVGLISSAWRMRQLQDHTHGVSFIETFEWCRRI